MRFPQSPICVRYPTSCPSSALGRRLGHLPPKGEGFPPYKRRIHHDLLPYRKIIKKTLDSVVISCGGVGYFVQIPATTGEALPPAGQEGTVYTIMNVTENDVSLYGFAAEEQRDCFKMLTGVTGVGPKAALSILSIMTPEKIALAASSGDHKAFTKAAGVGPKLAQRITLELKDKVGKGLAAGTGFSGNVAAPAPSSAPAQAVAALVSLGYAPSDAAAAVARVDETLSVQEIITIALRSLSRV